VKRALISPGKPRLFLPLRRKPRLFLPASGVREVALEGKPRLFLPAPVCEKSPSRESRAYFSRLN